MHEYQENLKKAGNLAIKNLGLDWWKNVDKEHSEFIAGLLNHLATAIKIITPKDGDSKLLIKGKKVPDELLLKLEQWIDKETPKEFDAQISIIKAKIEKLKQIKDLEHTAQELSNVNKQANQKEKKVETVTESQKPSINLNKLEEKISNGFSNMSAALEIIYKNNEIEKKQLKEHSDTIIKNLESKIFKLHELLEENNKRNIENSSEINKINNNQITNFDLLKQQLETKIDIKESIQILEIKNEIERYTTAEIVMKISKAIMPIIASIKTQEGMENHEGIKLLEEKCLATGLIGIERIYG